MQKHTKIDCTCGVCRETESERKTEQTYQQKKRNKLCGLERSSWNLLCLPVLVSNCSLSLFPSLSFITLSEWLAVLSRTSRDKDVVTARGERQDVDSTLAPPALQVCVLCFQLSSCVQRRRNSGLVSCEGVSEVGKVRPWLELFMFPPYRFVLRSFHVNPCSFLGTNKKTAKQNENNKKKEEGKIRATQGQS